MLDLNVFVQAMCCFAQVAGLDSLLALQVRSRYTDRLAPAGEPIAFVQSRSRLIHDRNVQVMLADELGKKVGLLRLKAPACPMRSPPHCTSAQCQRIRIADFAYLLLFFPRIPATRASARA
jgi:hypothetical protein